MTRTRVQCQATFSANERSRRTVGRYVVSATVDCAQKSWQFVTVREIYDRLKTY